MPEAAINEQRKSLRREVEIRPAWQELEMAPPAFNPVLAERPCDDELRRLVTLARDPGHTGRPFLWSKWVRHTLRIQPCDLLDAELYSHTVYHAAEGFLLEATRRSHQHCGVRPQVLPAVCPLIESK